MAVFGLVTILVVTAFILIIRQSGKPRYENRDYKSYRRNEGYATGNPFKRGSPSQDRNEQRTIAAAVVAIVVLAVLATIFFDVFVGLLIIIFLPVVVRFIRMRNQNNDRNRARGESRSSYS